MKDDSKNELIKLKEKRQTINQFMYAKRELINAEYKKIISTNDSNIKVLSYEKIVNLRDEVEELQNKINEIDDLILKLEIRSWNLISSNSKIDLYKLDDDIDGDYYIYLHDTIDEVGVISYDPQYTNTVYGDISYAIDDNYQGNGYAYEALCMLADHLRKQNVCEIRLSVNNHNIPSIKTIEKYEKVNSNFEVNKLDDAFTIYDFKLMKKLLKR